MFQSIIFDQYFVWNEKMRSELIYFYGIKKQKLKLLAHRNLTFIQKKKFELKKQYLSKKLV